jgi:hypothetical protein
MKRVATTRITAIALIALCAGTLLPAQIKPSAIAPGPKWLFQFDESLPDPTQNRDVRNDPRFHPLLERNLRQQAPFWNPHEPLWHVVETFLQLGGGKVKVKEHRYGIISGCVPHRCDEEEGFLWVDTSPKSSALIFAALTAIPGGGIHGSPSLFHLWIYSNHPLRQDFDNNESLPDEFLYPMQDWIDEVGGRHVISAMFVGPDSKMIPLLTQSLHLPAQIVAEDKTKESE